MDGVETIFIEKIRLTGDGEETQIREATNTDTVEKYAEEMKRGDQFPPVQLVPAGDGSFFITDGWHRILALKSIGRGIVDAIIAPVISGADPLSTAKRYALRANQKHGLPLSRGDQHKRARVALQLPSFAGKSVREIESEIGVGKSTIGRVRLELVREGSLPDPTTGEPLPDYIPDAYVTRHKLAENPFGGDEQLREDVFRFVAQLHAYDPKDWEFIADDEGGSNGVIEHRGLIEGQTLRFKLDGNSLNDGLPAHYEVVRERAPHDGPTLTQEDWNRIEAHKAKRAFYDARDRLMAHPDALLRKAVRTLTKYRETPGLWTDIGVFIRSGGPDHEHTNLDFDSPF